MGSTGEHQFRAHVARQDMPSALIWVAIVYGTLAVVTAVTVAVPGPSALLFDLPTVVVMLVAGVALRGTRVSDTAAVYVMSAVLLLLSLELLAQAVVYDEYSGLLYVLAIMVVWGPVVVVWSAALPPQLIVVAVFGPVAWHVVGTSWESWLLAVLAALGGGIALTYGRQSTIDSLFRARREIEDLAVRDPLTGLLNRHGLSNVTPTMAATATREGRELFVCFIDLDDFKTVNDRHGHHVGDAVLVAVADGIRHVVRDSDVVARWGGDEFVVVGMGEGLDPVATATRIREHVRGCGISAEQWPANVSIGRASGNHSDDIHELLAQADGEMYRRKNEGRLQQLHGGGDGI